VIAWMLAAVALLAAACASVDPSALPSPPATAAVGAFDVQRDTFAFPNEIRARHPDRDDLYANYCFVLARGVRQFFLFARFDPDARPLSEAEYVARVRAVVDHAPWESPVPLDERVVIPGYPDLHAFSRAHEAAVKEGLGGRLWTLLHWTNWRVTFPVTRGHQATVAREVVDELRAGRLVQLLVTNWPKPELNHTVVAYAFRATPRGMNFDVWDPNEPGGSGVLTFDAAASRFWGTRIYDTEPGVIRAFRMYYSWLL
jgi:hypothetical protein